MARDDVLEEHVAPPAGIGHLDEPRQHARDRNDAVAKPPARSARREADREVQRLVPEVGEGVAGIERDGREDWKDFPPEVVGDEGFRLRREVPGPEEPHAGALQVGEHVLQERLVLPGNHDVAARADRGDLLGGRERVQCRLLDVADQLLLEARDTNHEEFVEVRRGDREELEALEDRDLGIAGLFEHPFVEGDPGQLAIDEEPRVVQPLGSRRFDRGYRGKHGDRRLLHRLRSLGEGRDLCAVHSKTLQLAPTRRDP